MRDEGSKLDDVSLFVHPKRKEGKKKKKMRGTTLLDVDFIQFWSLV